MQCALDSKGYAESVVRRVTSHLLGEGVRPVLFADLAVPGANGIYKRIGYEAASEMVLYRFGPSAAARPD
ncbi:MAG: GNAT family N-acetyltransferase [Steroidobacteraceae bacterium]